jgi:hypothetical protein
MSGAVPPSCPAGAYGCAKRPTGDAAPLFQGEGSAGLATSSLNPVRASCSRVNTQPGKGASTISAVVRTMQPGITWPPRISPRAVATQACRWTPKSCWPGVARRLLTFLLLRQKKSKQKKRRPWLLRPSASLRATCGARFRRGLAKLAFGSNNAIPDPPEPPLLGASTRGGEGIPNPNTEYLKKQGLALASPCLYLSSWYFCLLFPLPIAPSWLGRGAQT